MHAGAQALIRADVDENGDPSESEEKANTSTTTAAPTAAGSTTSTVSSHPVPGGEKAGEGVEHVDFINGLALLIHQLPDRLREAFFTSLDNFMPDLDVDFEDDEAEAMYLAASSLAPNGDLDAVQVIRGEEEIDVGALKAEFEAASPFPHASIPDFVPIPEVYAAVKAEVGSRLEFEPKSNDLYDFVQSKELKTLDTAAGFLWLPKLRDAIYDPAFLQIMTSVTGIEIDPATIDMHALAFERGDYLGLHDDNVPGRRIAFILYLVEPEWDAASHGGALELYGSEPNSNKPTPEVLKTLAPSPNTFTFFSVSATSYHAVAEVTHPSATRLSVSGWLHGAHLTPKLPRVMEPLIFAASSPLPPSTPLASLISAKYLNSGTVAAIADEFAEVSCVSLPNFLRPDVARAVLDASFPSCVTDAVVTLPPDEGNYVCTSSPHGGGAGGVDVQAALASSEFHALLKSLTGLDDLGSGTSPLFRSFFAGMHQLLLDRTAHSGASGVLDVYLDLSTLPELELPERTTLEGEPIDRISPGSVVYMSETEVILSLPPAFNTLHLVYRSAEVEGDGKTLTFVKHVTCHAGMRNGRHDLNCMFKAS